MSSDAAAPARDEPDAAYADHHAELITRYTAALEVTPCTGLAVYSGAPVYRFRDDQSWPFRAGVFYQQWVPCDDHAGSVLLFRPGARPLLVLHLPRDYWHSTPVAPSGAWTEHFEIAVVDDLEGARAALPDDLSKYALVGEPDQGVAGGGVAGGGVATWGFAALNPPELLTRLEFDRLYKTPYEVACIAAANRSAVAGHLAARTAFEAGASEFDIHLAYLGATAHTDADLPYANIVALNEHGATLHYGRLDRRAPDKHRSFLIDAGARCRGYAADITRTWPAEHGGEFAALVEAVDLEQQALVQSLRPGRSYLDVHEDAQLAVAVILEDFGIVSMAPDDMVAAGVSNVFMPHGVGHHLGLQVHDTGGKLAGSDGTPLPQPEDWPALRNLRPMEVGNVFTIEPGIYFIDSLLEHLSESPLGRHVNWEAVDRLRPFGGVRVEDNIWMGPEGPRNLTREEMGIGPIF